MAMAAALEAVALSVFSASSSSSSKFLSSHKQLASAKLNSAYSAPPFSHNLPFAPLRPNNNFLLLCSPQAVAVEEAVEEAAEQSQEPTKIAFFKLPISFTAQDIKTLSAQCGTVLDAELITTRYGKSRGFGFATMSTAEEAQAVIDKFDSQEVAGKVIRVAKKVDKPFTIVAGHLVYVSNLAWKVRSKHLMEFFLPDFNPISAKVVFERVPYKRSAGYGFVKFATKEEAEAAISALNGKPLMDRPLQLKPSVPTDKSKVEEEDLTETQSGDP